ncbi:SpoIVB peptidase precursor [Oxobacter pfennigii]|uniref:SpoIVB peptidase n=1 Tax=Oxobacter pfennigii TaxID=36849 RepID=A0A0P8YYM9_9CLOT|nr:SpoIVB peptidase precursor [Oxobacter pfennigii]
MYRARLNKVVLYTFCCTIFIFFIILLKMSQMPNNIFLLEGENHLFDVRLPINVSVDSTGSDIKLNGSELNGDKVNLNLSSPFKIQSEKNGKTDLSIRFLGIIPLKHVTINVIPQVSVIPGGQSVGVKLNTKGVMVVGTSKVESAEGIELSPCTDSGIRIGDTILKINNHLVKDGDHVSKLINSCEGKILKFTIIRKEKELEINVKPVKSKEDNRYKIGAWIRDSTAGVGTLTFYCPHNDTFGALGHPITDVDTGVIMTVDSGKIVPSKIISIQPGMRGRPGELRGLFLDDEEDLGTIEKNTSSGIYGKTFKNPVNNIYSQPIPVGLQNQIKEGPAKILTTINGTSIEEYDIVIEKLTPQSKPNPKSMIIKVVDEELLQKTGGIVQGMSGSPIIQDGRLVGAVTHVFINRPDMGYGIYIEWMLKEAGIELKK